MKKSIPRVCRTCGASFLAEPRAPGRDCSNPCRHQGTRKTLAERFWPKVRITADCWLWMGRRQGDRYGVLTRESRDGKQYGNLFVHRVSWELNVGPIPEGLQVCHTCDVPNCVNPAHLFLGTQKDNIRDAMRKGRLKPAPLKHRPELACRGQGHYATRLTDEQVSQMRREHIPHQPGINVRLAEKFGVTVKTVEAIVNRRRWRHLD